MIAELAEANRREQNRHRNRMIEDAYNSSEQRHYRMPRSLPPEEDPSFDTIPSVYDLHAQNRQDEGGRLLPVGLLITLKGKQTAGTGRKQLNSTTVTTKKATLAQLEHPRRSRIQCTLSLSKNSSRQLAPSVPKPTWLCCPKEDSFDQLETRELTLREDQRFSKVLSILLPEKTQRRRGRQ
jgi:hypothetical protein